MSQQFGAPYGPAVVEELRKSVAEHWKALLVWTLAGALIVGGAAFVVGSSRSSAATVFISPLEANPFSPDPRGQTLTNLETEAQVAQSDAVLERASQAIGGSPSAGQLGRGLVVSIPADSQVLELDLTTSGATNAKLAVDAVAQAYLDVREERATLAISERQAEIAESQKVAQKQLRQAAVAISGSAAGSAARTLAEERLALASSELAELGRESATLAATSTYPGEILSPGEESGFGLPLVALLLGAVLGFLAGLATFAWRGRQRALRSDVVSEEGQLP